MSHNCTLFTSLSLIYNPSHMALEVEGITSSLSGRWGKCTMLSKCVPSKVDVFATQRSIYDSRPHFVGQEGWARSILFPLTGQCMYRALLHHARLYSPSLGFAQGCLSPIVPFPGFEVPRMGHFCHEVLLPSCFTPFSHKLSPSSAVGCIHSPS